MSHIDFFGRWNVNPNCCGCCPHEPAVICCSHGIFARSGNGNELGVLWKGTQDFEIVSHEADFCYTNYASDTTWSVWCPEEYSIIASHTYPDSQSTSLDWVVNGSYWIVFYDGEYKATYQISIPNGSAAFTGLNFYESKYQRIVLEYDSRLDTSGAAATSLSVQKMVLLYEGNELKIYTDICDNDTQAMMTNRSGTAMGSPYCAVFYLSEDRQKTLYDLWHNGELIDSGTYKYQTSGGLTTGLYFTDTLAVIPYDTEQGVTNRKFFFAGERKQEWENSGTFQKPGESSIGYADNIKYHVFWNSYDPDNNNASLYDVYFENIYLGLLRSGRNAFAGIRNHRFLYTGYSIGTYDKYESACCLDNVEYKDRIYSTASSVRYVTVGFYEDYFFISKWYSGQTSRTTSVYYDDLNVSVLSLNGNYSYSLARYYLAGQTRSHIILAATNGTSSVCHLLDRNGNVTAPAFLTTTPRVSGLSSWNNSNYLSVNLLASNTYNIYCITPDSDVTLIAESTSANVLSYSISGHYYYEPGGTSNLQPLQRVLYDCTEAQLPEEMANRTRLIVCDNLAIASVIPPIFFYDHGELETELPTPRSVNDILCCSDRFTYPIQDTDWHYAVIDVDFGVMRFDVKKLERITDDAA